MTTIGVDSTLRRADGVAVAGSIGEQVLWAPLRRPMLAEGVSSVLWELLDESAKAGDLGELVAEEFGIPYDVALRSILDSSAFLWAHGLIEISDIDPPTLPSRTVLPPNP